MAAAANGAQWDLDRPLAEAADPDGAVDLVPIYADTEQGRFILRHSTAHIMAEAVRELFPGVKVAIGPAIEDGFYYDFAREEPFTPEDLVDRVHVVHGSDQRKTPLRTRIKRMKELASANRRYGYLRLHAMLRREGLVANPKRTYRLYTAEGLQVRTKKRRKLPRPKSARATCRADGTATHPTAPW